MTPHLELMPIGLSKSTKRAAKRHVHGKVLDPRLRLACKFAKEENASHHFADKNLEPSVNRQAGYRRVDP